MVVVSEYFVHFSSLFCRKPTNLLLHNSTHAILRSFITKLFQNLDSILFYYLVTDSKNNNVLNGGCTSKRKADTDDSSKAKHAKIDRETKPFNRLLEGVTFAISGYQNPSRGELRSKACAMGAKYRPDWDNTCTHLM